MPCKGSGRWRQIPVTGLRASPRVFRRFPLPMPSVRVFLPKSGGGALRLLPAGRG